MGKDKEQEQEALRLKSIAETKFANSNLKSALKHAKKAHHLCPSLDGLSSMLTAFKILQVASNGGPNDTDWYKILQVEPFSHINTIKKQYKKLALELHPDKSSHVGCEEAFKLVGEGFRVLSDKIRRKEYDMRLRIRLQDEKVSGDSLPVAETFWTACSRCRLLHQFERRYMGHNLVCPSCKKSFKAVEVEEGDGGKKDDNEVKLRSERLRRKMAGGEGLGNFAGKASGSVGGIGGPRQKMGIVNLKGKVGSVDVEGKKYDRMQGANFERDEGNDVQWGGGRLRSEGLRRKISTVHDVLDRPVTKKVKLADEMMTLAEIRLEAKKKAGLSKVNLKETQRDAGEKEEKQKDAEEKEEKQKDAEEKEEKQKDAGEEEKQNDAEEGEKQNDAGEEEKQNDVGEEEKQNDVREEDKQSDAREEEKQNDAEEEENQDERETRAVLEKNNDLGSAKVGASKKSGDMEIETRGALKKSGNKETVRSGTSRKRKETEKRRVSRKEELQIMAVEDIDFYDFDRDRVERSFRKGQVWAIYDDEDGKPRHYGLIDEVVSVNPFEVKLSWLGLQNYGDEKLISWKNRGFHLSCGRFEVGRKMIVDSVNIFSHVVECERAAREVYRIYPKKGSVWALYNEANLDANGRSQLTSDKCSFDIVVFLTTYSEMHGLSMAYLEKVDGFKTIFKRREIGYHAIRYVRQDDIQLLSHQIPARKVSGDEMPELLKDCWELDPASLPPELLTIGCGNDI